MQELTLPHSPYQNAKQESFWAQLEGRLVAMLENIADLSLAKLNEITQAWVEHEYNRKRHSEIATTPLRRYIDGKDVGRPSPASEALRQAFCADDRRTQRKSDGTISLDGHRFELPSRYRHLDQVTIRRASWDLSWVHLIDDRSLRFRRWNARDAEDRAHDDRLGEKGDRTVRPEGDPIDRVADPHAPLEEVVWPRAATEPAQGSFLPLFVAAGSSLVATFARDGARMERAVALVPGSSGSTTTVCRRTLAAS